jgi:hypothetical protein
MAMLAATIAAMSFASAPKVWRKQKSMEGHGDLGVPLVCPLAEGCRTGRRRLAAVRAPVPRLARHSGLCLARCGPRQRSDARAFPFSFACFPGVSPKQFFCSEGRQVHKMCR